MRSSKQPPFTCDPILKGFKDNYGQADICNVVLYSEDNQLGISMCVDPDANICRCGRN